MDHLKNPKKKNPTGKKAGSKDKTMGKKTPRGTMTALHNRLT